MMPFCLSLGGGRLDFLETCNILESSPSIDGVGEGLLGAAAARG